MKMKVRYKNEEFGQAEIEPCCESMEGLADFWTRYRVSTAKGYHELVSPSMVGWAGGRMDPISYTACRFCHTGITFVKLGTLSSSVADVLSYFNGDQQKTADFFEHNGYSELEATMSNMGTYRMEITYGDRCEPTHGHLFWPDGSGPLVIPQFKN
jgi:hypothetical protein